MSQYRIISICERTVKIIHYAEEGASLITRGSKEKNAYLFQQQGHTNRIHSVYLENYIWICALANNLDQGIFLEVFDSFAVVVIQSTIWRWSNKL